MKIKFSQFLDQGGRDHMEDFSFTHVEERNNQVIFGMFGIFDGHGGSEAAEFVHKSLRKELIKIDKFWSNDNLEVLESIKLVFSKLQNLMWIEREKWIRRLSGYKSTAGSTASIAIIRNGILYTGHVGDSGIVLLYRDSNNILQSTALTTEHKPDNPVEKQRIEESGGSVCRKSGIERVVWHRKKPYENIGVDKISFLNVARSLGDLWSYDYTTDRYHVSPEPDVQFLTLDANSHRAIILASDGLWNVINRHTVSRIVALSHRIKTDPARLIIRYCLMKCKEKNSASDNVSVVVVTMHFESDSSDYHPSEPLDSDLLSLYQEFMVNNLIDNSLEFSDSRIQYTLDNVSDTTIFRCNPTHSDTTNSSDIDLIKRFLTFKPELSKSVCEWPDRWWFLLINALRTNLGLVSLSKMMYHFETCSPYYLRQTLVAFPWSICFQELICEPQFSQSLSMHTEIQNNLTKQCLLSPFWIDFYSNLVKKKLHTQPININSMKTTLISCWDEISRWLLLNVPGKFLDISIDKHQQVCGSQTPPFMPMGSCSDTEKSCLFSLRKAITFTEPSPLLDSFQYQDESKQPSPVFQCYQMRRSVSHDTNNLGSIFDSGSTTPLMAMSPERDQLSPATSTESIRFNIIPHHLQTQSKNHFVSSQPIKYQLSTIKSTPFKISPNHKPQEVSNTAPLNVLQYYRMKRSVSHGANQSSLNSMFESGSSTPAIPVSPKCGRQSELESSRINIISHKLQTNSKNHPVPSQSIKRKLSSLESTPTKVILLSKTSGNTSPSKMVKKFALTRQKGFIL